MIATDADNRDATHIGAAWRFTCALSPRPQVRAASGGQVNAYPVPVPVAGPAPAGPWAMYLTDAQRRYRYIGLDLDAHEGGAPQASRDATAIATVLDQAGIEHDQLGAGLNGYTSHDDKRIVIAADISPAQAAKTTLHEAAHAIMHAGIAPTEYHEQRGQCEVEAESVAHVVAGILGLDTSAYSVGYVAGWLKGDADLIRQSASRVLAAAHRIAEAIIEDSAD